jgi:hypothetical protein
VRNGVDVGSASDTEKDLRALSGCFPDHIWTQSVAILLRAEAAAVKAIASGSRHSHHEGYS